MKLILASNNSNKLREFAAITKDMDVEIVSQRQAGYDIDVDETGSTFEENAYLKAAAVTALSGLPAVADDSGLAVDALDGAPGIYSARYGYGHSASDSDRYTLLLKNLEGVTDRSARFICAICCTFPSGDVIRARGECEGEIMLAPVGSNGFGYDPVFKPIGSDRGMAQLSEEEKNAISHRGKALREFIMKLERYMNVDNK